jgi:hypothetical protein
LIDALSATFAYSKILSSQKSPELYHVYIDAFAGAGIHVSKSTGGFISGSPVNALSVDPPFKEYHFIDLDERKIDSLENIAGTREDVFTYHGDCNSILQEKVFLRARYTESTWNPDTGCTKISAGCTNCYAERMARRLKAMGQKNYTNGFKVALHPHALFLPLKWKKL